jgi:TatD DNase family protein
MMRLIDTHAHLYDEKFKDDIEEVIDRAREVGIERIYLPNIDVESIDAMLELEQRFPDMCVPTMGLHPCYVDEGFEKQLYIMEEWLNKRSFAAVGEMGTDLYWDKTHFDKQQEAFRVQCDWAIKFDLPIVVHCRESIEETIAMVEQIDNPKLRGIFHCFTGDEKQALRVIARGFKIGIGGVATFKNGGLDGLMQNLGSEHFVLETDSPYLAPVPYRGKRNEPAYTLEVAKKVADVKAMTLEDIARITSANADEIYRYSDG